MNSLILIRKYIGLGWYTEYLKKKPTELEDTNGVIIIRKLKNDRQNNGQKKDKRTNNDLQKTTQKAIKTELHETH